MSRNILPQDIRRVESVEVVEAAREQHGRPLRAQTVAIVTPLPLQSKQSGPLLMRPLP